MALGGPMPTGTGPEDPGGRPGRRRQPPVSRIAQVPAGVPPPPAAAWDDVIAVDSGGDFLHRCGIAARLVIGDLDSISPAALAWHRDRGAEVRAFPTDKDQTDFELALTVLPRDPAALVHLCGVWGGRFDHALMNLLVLPGFTDRGLFVFDTGEGCGGVMGPGTLCLTVPAGSSAALIALEDATGLSSEGVRWPLEAARLRRGVARGISNVTVDPAWRLRLTGGCLLWLVRGTARAGAGIGWLPARPPRRGRRGAGRDPAEG